MPAAGQRIQKRTPATVALQISSAKPSFITELAFTENISLHGVRIVTGRAWKRGEGVVVQSYHGTIQSRARVTYCHHLAKARYSVGLELHSAVDKEKVPEGVNRGLAADCTFRKRAIGSASGKRITKGRPGNKMRVRPAGVSP